MKKMNFFVISSECRFLTNLSHKNGIYMTKANPSVKGLAFFLFLGKTKRVLKSGNDVAPTRNRQTIQRRRINHLLQNWQKTEVRLYMTLLNLIGLLNMA